MCTYNWSFCEKKSRGGVLGWVRGVGPLRGSDRRGARGYERRNKVIVKMQKKSRGPVRREGCG